MSRISLQKLFLMALLVITLTACSGKGPVATGVAATQPAAAAAVPAVSFSKEVLPIFEANCTMCHGGPTPRAGLDLSTYTTALAGSSNGAVITPKDAAGSKLVELITAGVMPKEGTPLSAADIKLISDWINAGAPDN